MEGLVVFLMVCTTMLLIAVAWLGLSNSDLKSDLRVEKAKRDDAIKLLARQDKKYSDLADHCNKVIKAHNNLLDQKRKGFSNHSFTQEDLKRMKHYLHPDKHNGKTNDLFIKVNESLK